MNFLDEGTFVGRNAVEDALKDPEFKALRSDEKQKALKTLKMGGSVTTEKKRPDYPDVDGDGDREESMEKALKDKKSMKEEDEVKLPADTIFTLDLKHLMKKHGKEKSIKLTKKLMQQLHDKGKVEIDGTTLVFEMNMMQDTPLALPEPSDEAPARDYLGDDGKDYEGGMAKSQMLKMKKYAAALCDMIDDESQLEAWVQAKLTKASDYMSAVYHYLDYQKSKMDENINPSMMDTDEALVNILMSEANLSEETAEQVVDGLSGEDFKKAGLMMVRGIDERQIAKFVLSATTLDENINPKDIKWEDIEPDVENRPNYKEGTIYGTSADGRQWAAHGSYSEFDGYQVIGDLEEV